MFTLYYEYKIYNIDKISYVNFLTHKYEFCNYYLECNICNDKMQIYGRDCNPKDIPVFDCYAGDDLTCKEMIIKNIIE